MDQFDDIDALDWAIFDALADDFESVTLINETIMTTTNLRPSTQDIIDHIDRLYHKEYLFLNQSQQFNKKDLTAEIEDKTKDRKYWFGMTSIGSKAWQTLTDKYELMTRTRRFTGSA